MSDNHSDDDHVLVVGGGVIGAMCAWYLSEAGLQVTIVERDRFGAACSHGNCGYVSPSHVLPLTQPGAIRTTMKAMLGHNSPLSIKPRFSPSFWKWLWKFSRRCNHADMMNAAVGRHELLQSSQQLYKELIADENIECQWQERGLLFVFESEHHFDEYGKTDQLIQREFGVAATAYDGKSLVQLEPALRDGLGGAWHYTGDCHLRPDLLMSELRKKLESRGVTIVEHFDVQEIQQEHGAAVCVKSSTDELRADKFVVATGAWTPFLNQHLGCQIPIEPGKGYSLTMPSPARMPSIPMVFEEHRVAITPLQDKYRIGSTMEFAGYDTSINPRRLGLLKSSAERYLHEPYRDPIEERWYGWRPMTWDGKPIIDRCPALNNVWVAAGHNMLGVSLATGTGMLIAEMIVGEKPHVDPAHFTIARLQS